MILRPAAKKRGRPGGSFRPQEKRAGLAKWIPRKSGWALLASFLVLSAALSRYVDFYLSPRHRDDLTIGCPIPMLAADVSRTGGDVKAAFDAGLDRLTEGLGQLMPQTGSKTGGKKAALALLGEMAGVLGLSRAMGDSRQSADLLAGKRKALTL